MKYIYQIGRLDKDMSSVNFEIDGKEFLSPLSSFALKRYFNNEAKVILIYPLSIPFNKNLLNSRLDDNLKKAIENVLENRDEFFSDPFIFFNKHPHTKICDDFFIIHAIGEFEEEIFSGIFDDVVVEIFIDMVERAYQDKISELYIDISSGHNIYVSALLEATRYFAVFNKLQSWQKESTKIKIIFSDPIIGSSNQTYKIYKDYELKIKTFFSSPLTSADIISSKVAKTIAQDNREFKNKIQKMLENFSLCFSALKNNTPLILYSFDFDSYEQVDKLILEIITHAKKQLYQNWKTSFGIQKDEYLKSFLTLSFYKGILLLMSQNEIYKKDEVSIDEIKERFKFLYKVFGLDLNIELVGHEIYNLKEGKDEQNKKIIDKASSDWSKLSCYLYGGQTENFVKRNFLAHAGFERNITEVKVKDKTLYLRYSPESLNQIRKELINSI